MGLACQQLSGSFSLALRAMAPLQRPVMEEEMQSAQIISAIGSGKSSPVADC